MLKAAGRPLVDTFVTEVSQDTWIYLSWDMGLVFTPPIRDRVSEPLIPACWLTASVPSDYSSEPMICR